MLEIEVSKAGAATAVLRGMYLHSRYDPRVEAERFVQETLRDTQPSLVLLLGAGLGYLIEALHRKAPAARIIPVYYDRCIYAQAASRVSGGSGPSSPTAEALQRAWQPDSGVTLLEHLRAEISELECEGLAILEWSVSARLFPELSRDANRAVRQLLRELRGSLVTTEALGPLWLRNAFRNFVFLEDRFLVPRAIETPICIAASGPSLEEALPLIASYRDRFRLWALPSSLLALKTAGVSPDLVVLTDPGYYAIAHVHPAANLQLALAMPLTAACGAWRVGASVIPLSQGTFFERALCDLRMLHPLALPSYGTVAASALELARRLGAREVLFAGLDLIHRDLRSHARPNVFDQFMSDGVHRLSPFHHRLFARQTALAGEYGEAGGNDDRPRLSSPALDTYAGWFAGLGTSFGPALLRLLPTEVALPSFRSLSPGEFRTYALALPRVSAPTPSRRAGTAPSTVVERIAQAGRLLSEWAEELAGASRRPEEILARPVLTFLCYYTDAAALAEALRLKRLAGMREAASRLRKLASAGIVLLESIRSHLGGT